MRKVTHDNSRTPVLEDLLSDGRLGRLFSNDAHNCALQLWVLQNKSEQAIKNRVIYGRLLPYSYSDDSWNASDDDNFHTFGKVQVQVIRLNLYIKSNKCAALLRQLTAGRTISEISKELKLELSTKLEQRFGLTALETDNLAYRPVAYLLNRDAHYRHSLSSPHGGAGAFSASITQADKKALFRLEQDYNFELTAMVVKHLNADTGLDFGGMDTARFGDLELLVFPTLDDQERNLLNVSWAVAPPALVARFNPIQVPHYNAFQFRLCITNDGQVIYSGLATAESDAQKMFECKFELDEQLRAIADSTELEIFGLHDDHSRTGTLCCRWQIKYVREVNIRGHALGQSANPVKFDWLEKTTRPTFKDRVKSALTINKGNLGFNSLIGGRKADPWVTVNRDLVSLFARFHPPKSEGKFFLRRGPSDGEGPLQFVEWLRSLLSKYQQHQVVIFDPYFEDVGLGLLLICAAPNTDHIVFRTLPKPAKEDNAICREPDETVQDGVGNLLANCEHNRHLLKRLKLRIYGLKDGRLHDRYLLIMGQDSLPVAGFHLSNSFQKATENYPLLVTPISSDVLLQVEQYKSNLVQEAFIAQSEGETENPSIRLIFDSASSPTTLRHHEPLRFLDRPNAGDIMSALIGEPSLQGTSGATLKEQMVQLNLLKDDSLNLPDTITLSNCLAKLTGDLTSTWEVLGEVFAHSHIGDSSFCGMESEHDFMKFLGRYLNESFNRSHEDPDNELTVVESRLFRQPVESLLHSSYHPHHLFHTTKYAALNWAEYFAIRILWQYSPDVLLTNTEAQMASLPIEPRDADVVRLSLLSQIVSEISLSVQFDISARHRDLLVHSHNGLLQWIGFNAIEMELENPDGLTTVLQLMADFPYPRQVQILGWMINHAARNDTKADIYKGLVKALHEVLPQIISAKDLNCMVDSMLGHMRQLTWTEPWLFQDVVFPLLQNRRANIDDACYIWVKELINLLEPEQQSPMFNLASEGRTTNVAAFLFANSSPSQKKSSLELLFKILKRKRKIVQQPLASTSNWSRWNDALIVSKWILTFARWSQYYLREPDITDNEVNKLSRLAHEITMFRPMDEWHSNISTQQDELAIFLDEVEELLSSDIEKKLQ